MMSKARQPAVVKDDSRRLEEEARRMEAKLEVLRRTLDPPSGKEGGSAPGADSGSRWKSAGGTKPLTRGYVKTVLEAKPAGKSRSQQRPASKGRAPCGSAPTSGHGTPKTEGHAGYPGGLQPSESPPTAPALSDLAAPAAGTTLQPAQASAQAANGAEGGAAVGSRAAANLQAKLRKQSDEAAEVEAFLAGLKLDRYVGLFMEHGFDCMDVVKDMEDCHMRDIGMAPGHIIKLRKKISELAPAPSETQRRVSFGATEEAPAAEAPRKSALKASARESSTTAGTSNLAEGAFDEDESAASFQEALRAWREGREPNSGGASAPEVTAKASKGGSFWASMGGGEMDLSRAQSPAATPKASASTDTATEQQRHPAPGDEKLCCYNCYKQFFSQYAVERTAPSAQRPVRLCSEACASQWEASEQAKVEALRKRQEQLVKLQEMQRAMATDAPGAGGPPDAAATEAQTAA